MDHHVYEALKIQLEYLESAYQLHICIKDYVGFVPIDKELSTALTPYLGHNNPYCIFIKQKQSRYHHCLSMLKKIANKCLDEGCAYCGTCYAGVREYVVPIMSSEKLLGVITAGFFPLSLEEANSRIERAMMDASAEELETARKLYAMSITHTATPEHMFLPTLTLIASYLSMTYRMGQESVTGQRLITKRKASEADAIFTRAITFLHDQYRSPLTITLLAQECHCSESTLNHMLKKRLGVNFSTYVNKLRIEHAKEKLLDTNDSILSIALEVGFQDAKYFARVFRQLMDIRPTEFRRRYR